jgi:Xaa-Pro aminopeptidase
MSPKNSRWPENAVLYASPEKDANVLYATKFFAPDPILYLERGGKSMLVLNDLELGRGKKEAAVDEVVSLSDVSRKIGKSHPADVVKSLLKGRKKVRVPANFPVDMADALRGRGIDVVVKPVPFYERRLVKERREIRAIEAAQRSTEEAVNAAFDVLRRAKVRGGKLYHDGLVTAESLRRLIHRELLDRDCVGKDTIIACGEQACDPHNRGSGPILPDQPIVFDCFPRSEKSGYHADMSRTVLKGKASKKVRHLWNTVRDGQQLGCELVHAGVDGTDVHRAIMDFFEQEGYRTERRKKGWVGFFHGTGHGIGLDLHEPPWIGKNRSFLLPEGTVVTVEPGLYYPGLGGVRIEDMVLVTKKGCRNLAKLPKFLEL